MDNLVIRNARLIFRNFAGRATQFNAEGKRNFCVILDIADAERIALEGWNVRYLQPRDDEDQPTPYLQVAVSYNYKPPKINLISNGNKTPISEDMVDMLDWEEIAYVDLVVRPYEWNVGGRTGIKAYLKSMNVALEIDELDSPNDGMPF